MTTLRTSGEIRYAFATKITDLGTNTTLGTATRFDWASINVDIAESSSRTFLSVQLVMTCRDHFTVANLMTGIRMGIKLGAAATDDLDKTWTLTTTNRHEFGSWTRDVTDYFNANYGAGTTQTCVASIAVSTTAAANIGANICAELRIVYQYDDDVGTTRTRTAWIPIQSQSTALTTAQQELGTDGTNPAPANQIPALDTYLPEGSKTYKNAFVEVFSNDDATATTDFTPAVQIDATVAVSRSLVGEALWASGSGQPYRDIFNYDTTANATNVAHAFKMACDSVTTSRLDFAGGFLYVTYTFDKSATTRGTRTAILEMRPIDDLEEVFFLYGESAGTGDKQTFVAEITIDEPGTITILQSAAVMNFLLTSTIVGNLVVAAGSQAERTYTPTSATAGEHQIVHRCDHGSGWALSRGKNRLLFTVRSSAATTRHNLQSIFAVLTYTSDVPASGEMSATRVASFIAAPTSGSGTSQAIAALGQRAPNLGAFWRLLAYHQEGRYATGQSTLQVGEITNAGELDGAGLYKWRNVASTGSAQMSWKWFVVAGMKSCNAHSLVTGRFDITQAHALLGFCGTNTFTINLNRVITFNNLSFTVAGTVTVNGSPVADGKVVNIFARDSAGVTEHITDATVAGGAGGFTCQVPGNTRTYWASYKDGGNLGRSDDGTPGTSTFNITIGVNSTVLAAAVWNAVSEGTEKYGDQMRLCASFAAGAGARSDGDGSYSFKSKDGTKDRIAGNRTGTAVTITTRDGT